MAAHVMRLNNDLLPNTFPVPQPSRRGHGMISEYESQIISQQKSVKPEIHGSLKFHEDDEDYLPKMKPQPSASDLPVDFHQLIDPSLCVTPEKKSSGKMRSERLNRGSDEGTSLKPRNSQKVRFEDFVKVKQMSPEGRGHSQIASHSKTATSAVHESSSSSTSSFLNSGEYSNNSELDISDDEADSNGEEVISIMASDLRSSHHASVIDTAVSSVTTMLRNSAEVGMPVNILESADLENMLARPELNSTLQVSREIRDIKESQLDIVAAIKQKLQLSEQKKAEINEKASNKVNATANQFTDLVTVEVQAEELFDAKSRQKAAKVKMQSLPKGMKPEENIPAPDILDYFKPEFIHETASFTVTGLPYLDTDPDTAPTHSAFEVYRHIRSWEDW